MPEAIGATLDRLQPEAAYFMTGAAQLIERRRGVCILGVRPRRRPSARVERQRDLALVADLLDHAVRRSD